MQCKRAVYNGLSSELYTHFDFQPREKSVPLSFLILICEVLVDKQMCFEIHHYFQNKFYLRKNYNILLLDYLVSLELPNVLFYLQ